MDEGDLRETVERMKNLLVARATGDHLGGELDYPQLFDVGPWPARGSGEAAVICEHVPNASRIRTRTACGVGTWRLIPMTAFPWPPQAVILLERGTRARPRKFRDKGGNVVQHRTRGLSWDAGPQSVGADREFA